MCLSRRIPTCHAGLDLCRTESCCSHVSSFLCRLLGRCCELLRLPRCAKVSLISGSYVLESTRLGGFRPRHPMPEDALYQLGLRAWCLLLSMRALSQILFGEALRST